MANEQNQGTQNQDTQNTSSTTGFGESNKTAGSPQSFGSSTPGGSTGTSAKQAREDSSLSGGEGSITDSVKSTAKGLIDQAKDTAGQAYGAATEKAAAKIDEQRTNVASGLTSVADSIKQVGENLRETDDQTGITSLTAKYGETFANQIEQVSNYFERKDVREMVRDVESFARRNPVVFIGGAFALGFLAARFLKSSSPKQLTDAAGASFSESNRSSADRDDNIHVFNSGTEQQGVTFDEGDVKNAS